MTGATWLSGIRPSGPVIETRTRRSSMKLARFRREDDELVFRGRAVKAHLVILQLRRRPPSVQSLGGRSVYDRGGPAGSFKLVDLEAAPQCRVHGPFDKVHLYIPQTALDDMADEVGSPRIDRLHASGGGWAERDPILSSLTAAIIASTETPGDASKLFVDHMIFGLRAHLARRYGGLRERLLPRRGGLAPWQVSRAKDYIRANLAGEVSVTQVASECGLSSAHFSRAFKASTGMTPHAWLQTCRVTEAQALLRSSGQSLAEIAQACGFFDQSHFTRVFARIAGQTPHAWRRASATN